MAGQADPSEAALRAAVARELPGVRADLERLVAIPSIAFPGFDHAQVQRSADATAELLRGCGLAVRVVRAGGQPAVIGTSPAPAGAPTVLLYAHHDVQPIGDADQWDSDPFTATERDGRLYGRGTADDKAGIMAHVAALRALRARHARPDSGRLTAGSAALHPLAADGTLPVGVVVFVEGEEEHGSESLGRLLDEHRDALAADVIVIADSSNWEVGVPALTTSLRGLVNLYVEVRTLNSAVHSGMYGGAVPDALMVLCRMLATLHDEAGDVAVAGLRRGQAAPLEYPAERLRADAGVVDGVALTGTGPLVDRLWFRPSLSVLGIDAPGAADAPNALVPSARAKLSLRIAPGEDPEAAYEAVERHLRTHAPWDVPVSVSPEQFGPPCVIDATGPAHDVARAAFRTAWDGVDPVDVGLGGSIPFIATFQEMFPDAAVLVTGVEDPYTQAHGPNESLHLAEFARVCLAEALLLEQLPARLPAR